MTVKMIIERIIKNNEEQSIYSFELIQSWSGAWDHQFEYVFTDETRKTSFSWTSQIFGFEKMLLFLSRNMFFYQWSMKILERRKQCYTWKDDHPIK